MSIKQNSLSRLSSINTFYKNSSKKSKHQLLSHNINYSPSKSRKISNIKGSIVSKRESINSNKFKNYNRKRISQLSSTSIFKVKRDYKNKFYNKNIKIDLKSIMKSIKLQLNNKYNNIYYIENITNINNNQNQVQYLLSDYYAINNILNNKRFHLTILLKEYEILYNSQELFIRYYDKKERYIIMKYLLNFVYKYDELCYDINKEINDYEKKEELVAEFDYITANQFLYENLLESDLFKGFKYLLKRINLSNKKAQYDYTYLDMTKSKNISEENQYIINAIKILNDFMNNRKFLEKKLIKNMPLKKVPNSIPNYYPLGYGINSSLENYKSKKKYKKVKEPGNETKELINIIEEEKSDIDIKKNKKDNNLMINKNVLFNIDEKITENESSIGDSENNYYLIKKTKKNINNFINNNNHLLPSSLYEMTEKDIQLDKDKDLVKNNIKQINYKLLYDNKLSKTIKRSTKDPDIIDIEQFLYLFPRTNNLNKKNSINLNKYDYNKNISKREIKSLDNENINEKGNSRNSFSSLKNEILFNKKKIETKIKFEGMSLQIKNNNNQKNNIFTKLNKFNNLFINKNNRQMNNNDLPKNSGNNININMANNKNNDISLLSSLSNYNMISNKLNHRKISRNFFKTNKISPLVLTPNSINNISSTLFSDINYLSQNLSINPLKNENKKNFLSSKNNMLSINDNNLSNNFSYDKIKNKRKKNNFNLCKFKKTQDFIKGSKEFYNKINIKPQLFLLKNISFQNINISQDNKLNNNNSPQNEISNYMENNLYNNDSVKKINNISEYIKKFIYRQKRKESKNFTLNQIIKNSDIYSSDLS